MKEKRIGRAQKLLLWCDRTIMVYTSQRNLYRCYYDITVSTLRRFEMLINFGDYKIAINIRNDITPTGFSLLMNYISAERTKRK